MLQYIKIIDRDKMFDSKQKKINEQISDIFRPENYSVKNALMSLDRMGGILGLINHLRTCHRRGISANNTHDHEQRIKQYGQNCAPFGQNIFKKYLFQQRDFIVNFLFYLLTLRICVKLILFRDELRGLNPLGDQQFHLHITAEVTSYFLLIGMILLKASVSVEYHNMDQDERKYKNSQINVRRDGEKVKIFEENLMVGDILIVEAGDMIRVDGIVVKARNFAVGEAHTILKGDMKTKKDIWSLDKNIDENKDPFVLAGSFVIGGSAQILVCSVGPKCSFRIDNRNKGYYSEYTSTIAELKKTMNTIQNTSKIIAIILATFVSTIYLVERYYDQKRGSRLVTWIDFLYILKVFCGYIGLVCFVQRLKIIKTLQFFIEANRSEKQYRIKNRATLQLMSQLDILFIESSTLAMRKVPTRDSIRIQLDHVSQISEINKFCHIKIISEEDRSKICEIFGKDINPEHLFQPNEDISYNAHVKSLAQATFLTKTSVTTFINDYLPIYRALKYEVGYLYDSNNPANRDIPSDIIQISFQRLFINPMYQMPDPQSQNTNQSSMATEGSWQFWVKIQNKLFMEDVLYKLFYKSRVYADLYSVYLTLYINNVLVMATMCYFSTFISLINLSWYLLIIIINRYMFFTIYRRITQQRCSDQPTPTTLFSLLKLNLILLPYYIYVSNRVLFISSLFVFFFTNGLLRVQVILYKKRPFSKKVLFKNMGKYFCFYVVVHALVYLLELGNPGVLIEEIRNVQYVVGLFLLYVGYAIIV